MRRLRIIGFPLVFSRADMLFPLRVIRGVTLPPVAEYVEN